MAKISDLLKWKDNFILKDPQGKELRKIWLRVVGDEDLKESFTNARLASAALRKQLKDPETTEYQERITPIDDASFEECLSIIMSSRSQNLQAEAFSSVVRPDEVRIDEIAVDPDAPTLEEQEKLDAENKRVDDEYQAALQEFIDVKKNEISAEWDHRPLDDLREQAKLEASAIMSLGEFLTVLEEEKCWRSVYEDEKYKVKAFDSLEDFRSSHSFIKDQVLEAYRKLELGPEQIKN
jgi:hypothetical protein